MAWTSSCTKQTSCTKQIYNYWKNTTEHECTHTSGYVVVPMCNGHVLCHVARMQHVAAGRRHAHTQVLLAPRHAPWPGLCAPAARDPAPYLALELHLVQQGAHGVWLELYPQEAVDVLAVHVQLVGGQVGVDWRGRRGRGRGLMVRAGGGPGACMAGGGAGEARA